MVSGGAGGPDSGLELITDPMGGEDVAGVFGVGLELLAEREDEVVDGSW
jgi:hypothetical protein